MPFPEEARGGQLCCCSISPVQHCSTAPGPLFHLNNSLWIPRTAKAFWEPLTQHTGGHTEGVAANTEGFFLTVAPNHFTQAASEV